MPDKALSVATYAAGASLATIALVYVFAPTYFIDNVPSTSSNPLSALSGRKTGVVGLSNAANDCFINSVLQALAGLGDLRIYLIRETHRRKIDDVDVYQVIVPQDDEGAGTGRRPMPAWKIAGLQAGLVSKGLKDMIDQLNERPIYKKIVSAGPFVRVLETAFQQRISRQQQDAQEFLQIVAERLCDEYHAGRRARRYAKRRAEAAVSAVGSALDGSVSTAPSTSVILDGQAVNDKLASLAVAANTGQSHEKLSASSSWNGQASASSTAVQQNDARNEEEEGFPMEGKIESQIECLTCGFKSRPSEQPFCTLTLSVPQTSSTSLSACFDSMLKTEYIDDFKCEKCRLVHAVQVLQAEAAKSKSESFRKEALHNASRLQQAIDTDPERPPPDIVLPDARYAPKRRIARHFRLISFPKVLAIHLSRSIYDASKQSQKNSAKVSFPERLPLGSILHQRKYKLVSVVMHKGSHHSGHYESFRRQTIAAPYSNPNTFQPSQAYSPSSSPAATTPRIGSNPASSAARPVNGISPVSSTTELPPVADLAIDANGNATVSSSAPESAANLLLQKTRSSHSSSSRDRASSTAALPPAPTPAPGSRDCNGSADATAETSSIRSITRSTLSRITTSSRSGSRSGNRRESLTERLSLRPGSKDGGTGADKKKAPSVVVTAAPQPRPRIKKTPDRWWQISDEKVREASTKEVLGMQREVYLLFYDLERDPFTG
ncbi:hypothetical protein SEPCBS57363_004211 [Sporothrix epigloea]|uniref:Ubiquitin carboxyl-terminal hydrolase n=1 Tax=Sporothrix epigloea TaxID=1892477 RepID=A0ABP0DQS1_9PEZI